MNLRFADDVLLVARCAKALKHMLEDLREAMAKVRLEMRFGKTKRLANAQEVNKVTHLMSKSAI